MLDPALKHCLQDIKAPIKATLHFWYKKNCTATYIGQNSKITDSLLSREAVIY